MSNDGEKYKTPAKIQPNVENNSHSMMLGYVTKPTPVILDVGCACGDLGVALKEYKNATVFGLEYSNDSIAIAKSTGAYADVRQSDLDAFTANDVQDWQGKFDYVICGDVLEHLRNPTRTVSELVKFLKPDGEFIASIPNVAHMYVKGLLMANMFRYSSLGLLDETHIHFFTSEGIAEMLAADGMLVKGCGFSFVGKNEWNGIDPWGRVPVGVQKAIFKEFSSYVLQYVLRAVKTENPLGQLRDANGMSLTITEDNAPSYILAERQRLLAEVGLTPEEKEIESKNTQLSATIAQLAVKNAKLNEVLNSRSWRITKPLRFVGKVVRGLTHIVCRLNCGVDSRTTEDFHF